MRPTAVANSASAIPGATTAREVFFDAAIDWKLDMMPQTVPNRPTKAGGADGRQHQQAPFQALDLARDRDVHHLVDAHLQAGDRAGVAFKRTLPLAHRRHEAGCHGVRRLGRQRAIELLDRLPGPERLLEPVHRAPGARVKKDLVDGDAQTQTEQARSPSITAFTIQ